MSYPICAPAIFGNFPAGPHMLCVVSAVNAHGSSVPSGTKLNFGKSESMEAEIADHVWSLEEVIALLG